MHGAFALYGDTFTGADDRTWVAMQSLSVPRLGKRVQVLMFLYDLLDQDGVSLLSGAPFNVLALIYVPWTRSAAWQTIGWLATRTVEANTDEEEMPEEITSIITDLESGFFEHTAGNLSNLLKEQPAVTLKEQPAVTSTKLTLTDAPTTPKRPRECEAFVGKGAVVEGAVDEDDSDDAENVEVAPKITRRSPRTRTQSAPSVAASLQQKVPVRSPRKVLKSPSMVSKPSAGLPKPQAILLKSPKRAPTSPASAVGKEAVKPPTGYMTFSNILATPTTSDRAQGGDRRVKECKYLVGQ